ncbi:hypothetical protein ASF92_09795 [Pedobacter sp. Leaf176]|nr:hypothetical protein ASF92_09795 [Pedobacter sp. Leaf176]
MVTHQPLEQKASFFALLKQQPGPSCPSAGGYYKSASVKNGMRVSIAVGFRKFWDCREGKYLPQIGADKTAQICVISVICGRTCDLVLKQSRSETLLLVSGRGKCVPQITQINADKKFKSAKLA